MNEKGKTGKGNWGKMLLAVASWEWLPVFGLAMSGRVRLLSTHGWSIILMWAVRECAAWEDTKLILKNTGEKNCTGLPSLSLKQTVGTDTVWEAEDETWSDSQVEGEVLHWKRGMEEKRNGVKKKVCINDHSIWILAWEQITIFSGSGRL